MRKAMIKKTTAALLTAAMAVSLAGCGKDNNADSGKSDDVSKEVQYSQIKLVKTTLISKQTLHA